MTLTGAVMAAGPNGRIRRAEWEEGVYASMSTMTYSAYRYGSRDHLSGDKVHGIQSGALMHLDYYEILEDDWEVED